MSTPNGGYPHDQELRARIQAFSPDEPGVVFPFSARLARENGWTRPFAERVVGEYRRFLYLAMTARHPVTPSVQVDQAWHQHLTYTRSYWDELCGRVLGRPLHHDPTRGGRAEGDKFVDWYARTLDSYRAAFGQEPPADVWPAPAERFASKAHIRQVSDATHWIIRKPRLGRGRATAAAGFAALLAVAACTGDDVPGLLVGSVLAGLVIILIGIVHTAQPPQARRVRRSARRSRAGVASDGAAWLWIADGSGDNCDSPGGGDCGDGGGGGGCGGGGCGGG